ncbi:MAG: hypothetical protein KDM64_15460, partial [Verrucomicrobiae bacterium]|nr:hypothetical protein [Verrucomicrobiae bacterium]
MRWALHARAAAIAVRASVSIAMAAGLVAMVTVFPMIALGVVLFAMVLSGMGLVALTVVMTAGIRARAMVAGLRTSGLGTSGLGLGAAGAACHGMITGAALVSTASPGRAAGAGTHHRAEFLAGFLHVLPDLGDLLVRLVVLAGLAELADFLHLALHHFAHFAEVGTVTGAVIATQTAGTGIGATRF